MRIEKKKKKPGRPLKRGLEEKLDVYSVLTGADIQRNYFTVARRRTLNLTDLEMQYLLILGELQVISVTDGAKFEVERGYGE